MGPDFELKSLDFDFLGITRLFWTRLSPDSIPLKKEYANLLILLGVHGGLCNPSYWDGGI